MNVHMRLLAISFGVALFSTPALADAVLEDTTIVVRGTSIEEVRQNLGEALETRVAGGYRHDVVEHWTYPDGLVVVVQGGYVIDSFIEKQN